MALTRFMMWISEDQKQRLEQESEDQRRSQSEIIRMALDEYLGAEQEDHESDPGL